MAKKGNKLMGGVGSDLIEYIQDPLRVCRSPDLFPALFDT